ncbi:DUF1344 domain-containing protein [Phyllobacterium sp. SYP-B3895]|uniref:DUF1344 domain-containing protein n=1 Tax=Phyllobacterium sp. SYP-B3895 TaxID=2663240 RepID=UPI0012999CA9|nr:DUF1344 domain-containing protein [Phyllobacterium sp. SYP-B3895]MRG56782.1 DUF1344 domain-containing protein [Phyllobacterium sp. SYP-B3895]
MMKKLLLVISALALTAGLASAQGQRTYTSTVKSVRAMHSPDMFSTTGTIEWVSPQSRTVQLTTGTKYQLPANADFRGIAAGEKVRITWKGQDPYNTSFGNGESDEFHAAKMVVVH